MNQNLCLDKNSSNFKQMLIMMNNNIKAAEYEGCSLKHLIEETIGIYDWFKKL